VTVEPILPVAESSVYMLAFLARVRSSLAAMLPPGLFDPRPYLEQGPGLARRMGPL
jgi:hypothetical protein